MALVTGAGDHPRLTTTVVSAVPASGRLFPFCMYVRVFFSSFVCFDLWVWSDLRIPFMGGACRAGERPQHLQLTGGLVTRL